MFYCSSTCLTDRVTNKHFNPLSSIKLIEVQNVLINSTKRHVGNNESLIVHFNSKIMWRNQSLNLTKDSSALSSDITPPLWETKDRSAAPPRTTQEFLNTPTPPQTFREKKALCGGEIRANNRTSSPDVEITALSAHSLYVNVNNRRRRQRMI